MKEFQLNLASSTDSFTRPNDTTAYAQHDLVANDTTAANVDPLTFTFLHAGWLRKAVLHHTNPVAANGVFKLWIVAADFTPTNGDNGAFGGAVLANILAVVDITANNQSNTGGAIGETFFTNGQWEIPAGDCFGFLQVDAAYTPGAQEVFTVTLSIDNIP